MVIIHGMDVHIPEGKHKRRETLKKRVEGRKVEQGSRLKLKKQIETKGKDKIKKTGIKWSAYATLLQVGKKKSLVRKHTSNRKIPKQPGEQIAAHLFRPHCFGYKALTHESYRREAATCILQKKRNTWGERIWERKRGWERKKRLGEKKRCGEGGKIQRGTSADPGGVN